MTNAPEHSEQHRTAFISAMRGVGTSVTVVTTNGKAGRRGATVSAFVRYQLTRQQFWYV